MESTLSQAHAEERLPWHKPEMQHLVVVFDTKNTTGSGPDGLTVEEITG
jgi:hypothetical protein